uniref:Uncharacterized protein n=1 Tax=Anguilla anguilla TaxID=7936 RepID=A0A0E9QA02_ANGAN
MAEVADSQAHHSARFKDSWPMEGRNMPILTNNMVFLNFPTLCYAG